MWLLKWQRNQKRSHTLPPPMEERRKKKKEDRNGVVTDFWPTEAGAPWRNEGESDTVKPGESARYHHPTGPSDIEVASYSLLAYNTLGMVSEGREILLWLQKKQNSKGGFRSTQVCRRKCLLGNNNYYYSWEYSFKIPHCFWIV